jgi:hypothetical protein
VRRWDIWETRQAALLTYLRTQMPSTSVALKL